jgi:hypothetical protein
MNKIMSHIIWLECLKILTHRKLCNLFAFVKMFLKNWAFQKYREIAIHYNFGAICMQNFDEMYCPPLFIRRPLITLCNLYVTP